MVRATDASKRRGVFGVVVNWNMYLSSKVGDDLLVLGWY